MDITRAQAFNKLPPHEQAELVLTQGCYLHHRIKGWCKIDLYWMHDFYVELWFLYDLKSIGLVRALTDYTHLEPYLETIKLQLARLNKKQ
ncbi:hypothetical protein MKJ04_07305 [Pontibacter sp. E15-1]|uniref:hypothetical protein n=1 Tax=Pontibacter sp. E15-1 TaxID=2919918 RepID=UPI001F4FB2EE|nr:hypothetical protein [Pontibacter sp. E15-1]MCJ8164648.1 hypothetical protein [Pontibacter sp. E15-1]